MIRQIVRLGLGTIIAAILLPTIFATAAVKDWTDGTGNWSTAANWSGGTVPVNNDLVNIYFTDGIARTITYNIPTITLGSMNVSLKGPGATNATLSMAANGLTIGTEYVGYDGRGTIDQSGGTNSAGTLDIGVLAGSAGTYNLNSVGALVSNMGEYIGDAGVGVFNQTGGTNAIIAAQDLLVGSQALSMGTYALSGGSLSTEGFQFIGDFGNGALNQTGGTNNGNLLFLGRRTGSSGTYTLSAGQASFTQPFVGGSTGSPGGTGVLIVSGTGVFNVLYALRVYNSAGTSLNLTGGTINAGGLDFRGAPAAFNWTSGKLNLTSNVTWDPAAVPTTIETITSAAFGAARILGASQTLMITGDETLGDIGAFALTLNSGSTHNVTGSLTINPTGTITQNIGSTLNAATIIQSGGTVNGALQNQGNFIYQSGLFNGRLLNQGTVSLGPNFTAANGVENDASMTVAIDQTLTLNGAGLDNQGVFTLAGTLNVTNMTSSGHFIFDSGTLSITGAGGTNVASIVSNTPNTTININANNVSLGNAASFTGFNHQGTLNVGANTITLNSAGFARLGIFTSLGGGTINAPNGIALGTGSNLVGNGTVNARISGEAGSLIEANGALTLGDVTSPAGMNFGGELHTKQFAVTLNASGPATLGSLTTLGTTGSAGTLNASNGVVVDFGDAVTGFGTINSTNTLAKRTIINGTATGTDATHPLTFTGYVKGVGTFNNVNFAGTFSPGLSPTVLTVGSVALAATNTLIMELGGSTPGDAYDEIQATGSLSLAGTLQVALINGFTPTIGQSFDLFDWGNLSGAFSSIQLPTLASGLTWNTSQLYATGVLSVNLIGDYNHNGVVDAADYVAWREGLGTIYTQNDYNVWRANFGRTAGGGSGATATEAVPEPTTLVLLMFASGSWCLSRSRAA